MTLTTVIPRPPLSAFINLLWSTEGPVPTHTRERLLPDGMATLVFTLRDGPMNLYSRTTVNRAERFFGALISGPQARSFLIDTQDTDVTVGVHFRAGGAAAFFDLPISELAGVHSPLSEVWKTGVEEVRQSMLEAPNPTMKLNILQAALLARLPGRAVRHRAITHAVRRFLAAPNIQIKQVVEETGLSSRRFIHVFSQDVGLTPKLFCRVQRFQNLLKTLAGKKTVDWAQLALASGYYDQAHLVHDFHDLAGQTPSEYLAGRTPWINHVIE